MERLLALARAGFESLDLPESIVSEAMVHLESWLVHPLLREYHPQIESLAEAEQWGALLDAFYRVIPFGTGGRRGPVGIGSNRINPWTIATSIQGHAQFLQREATDSPSVVIAYDVRRFLDQRGIYNPELPNPVLGWSSRDFAELAAGVYAANGIRVHILPRGTDTWLSTPELSFAIRYLGAGGGLNVSASHNPPDDNGAKIYDSAGGQAIPPHDEALAQEVERVSEPRSMSYEEALDAGWIVPIEPELHRAYVDHNLTLSRWPTARGAKVVFTPLHGTGCTTVVDVLREAGFDVTVEPEQGVADGAFPAVPFSTPNPEVPQSMDRAVALARQVGADLVMACDPDADRLGLVVHHNGSWRPMNGNELGALVVDTVLKDRDAPAVVFKTEVTTSLISRIATSAGASLVDDLLVGFKYIGAGIRELETEGSFAGVSGSAKEFACGVEESHGVLVTSEVRDKDAAGAALLLAERASLEAQAGRTLVDTLEEIWRAHGYVSNRLVSTVMRGALGRSRIEAIQAHLRENPPAVIGGRAVVEFSDHLNPASRFGEIVSGTDAASRDVLVFVLEGGARLILRPSGTEPKTKVYAEMPGALEDREGTDGACQGLAVAFVQDMLERVGIELPAWALAISDLVPVEQKQHFATELFPELVRQIEMGGCESGTTDADRWLNDALASYGRDARALVWPGVLAWMGVTEGRTNLKRCLESLLSR